ncbi:MULTISPECIES: translation initiation factor IF-2 [unclassified Synechocystis]|uniref:translation initiation factor IF-2 n=1 Tax=unclassified Synechocystis TaxID=2640012 RepID=UPI00041AC2B1|nr:MULTISPECIES: translation initiation factor IF-2 [unclassified Synechocystis]AIE75102.1 Translation initiation factor 2 [Synechocystis sp. PCC 6714]MCT0253200.1 translation initiation factor IF-2 [Synechocystis sp. CS-94]
MNNAKVRIYDLSKELNLENRDILDICERLNVAAKSHSSTISESDADRIKAAAQKFTPQQPKKPRVANRSESKQDKSDPKQQKILAIHHKQEKPGASVPARPTPPPRPKLQAPKAPTPPQAVVAKAPAPKASKQEEPLNETTKAVPAPPLAPPPVPSLQAPPSKVAAPTPPAKKTAPAPRLAGPPSRTPAPSKPAPPAPAKPKTNRPEIVSLKDNRGQTRSAEREEKVVIAAPEPPKPKVELRRPKPPRPEEDENLPELLEFPPLSRGKGGDGDSDTDDGDLLSTEKPKPKLKRPTPPRLGKPDQWEDDEDEKANKAKAANKGKRRPKMDEDDDDLDMEGDNGPKPTLVSLSIARPPKPKSLAKPSAPTVAKVKKPTLKSEAGSSPGGNSRSRGDRRDRKEVVQKPEVIMLNRSLTVRDLADLLKVSETDIIKRLFLKGVAVQITQTLDEETARMVAESFEVAVETPEKVAAAAKTTEMLDEADLDNLVRRPPVVTIMGHVDHGKTTLLDSIRKTKVAQGEAGGITQHIGAYHVEVEHNGKTEQIVFLDTPGHEAFTAMRARGAKVTDIAILVVAADDGVQPQTREAISHAKAAGVPLIVAINKVDKPEANPDRIKQELSELGLLAEEWGGDTIMVPVSALNGDNLDGLLEMILLVSEVEELVANPNRQAKGTVIEANLDRTRGPVATLLIQNGTLRVGDAIVVGAVYGKIRAMIDDRGDKVEEASPSFAVEILGLGDVPAAGDEFEVFTNEKDARLQAEARAMEDRQTRLQQAMSSRKVTLSSISAQAQEGELKELNIILKADVQGSVGAILGALEQLPQGEVQIRVLLASPGEVTETDVDLAAASGAIIIGFNTTLATGARQAADREGVDIREYDIIYKLLDDIQGAMEGLLDPEEIESSLGTAEVRAVFPVGRGNIAGCYVQSGKIIRNRNLRVRRGDQVVFEGNIDSLKRIKEDAREVNAGYECGIGCSKFNEWKEGDIIEAYEMTMKRRTLAT